MDINQCWLMFQRFYDDMTINFPKYQYFFSVKYVKGI